jgi:MFS family permease
MTTPAITQSSSVPSSRAFRISAALVTLAMVAYGMGQTVVYTIVPPLARGLSLNEIQIGLMTSCAAVCAVIAAPLWGRVSDRVGRGLVIAICIVLYSLTNVMFTLVLQAGTQHVLAGSALLAALIATRALFGAGSVGLQPTAAALMADVSPTERRGAAMAYVGLGLGLGMILGPLYAVFVAAWGAIPTLLLLSLIPLPLLLLVPGIPTTQTTTSGERGPGLSLLNRSVLPIVILSVSTYLGMAMLQQTVAFLVQDRLHLPTAAEAAEPVGIALGGFAIAMLLVQIVMTRTAPRRPMIFVRMAMPILAIGYGALLVAGDIRVISAGMVVIGLGFGMAVPSLLAAASERVSPEFQGAVAGVMSAAPALSFVIGPVLAGALYSAAQWLPFAVLVGVTLAAGLLAAATRSMKAEKPNE